MSSSRHPTIRGLRALALLVALAGCGFQPMYGERPTAAGASSGVADQLASVDIANIPDRRGQQLRNMLIDRFHLGDRAAASRYRLEVTLQAFEQKLALRKDASAERAQLVVTAPFRLVDSATGRPLLQASSRAFIGYNILEEAYGTLASADDAYDRALTQISDEITSRVAMQLARGS